MTAGERFASAAEVFTGAPFRLHGRDPATGLDCVGLVACALAACGRSVETPEGYRLRNATVEPFLGFAAANGFYPVQPPLRRGDLVVVRPGPAQTHLLVVTGSDTFVHAHAGLRRVVAFRGPLPWPTIELFRLSLPLED